MGDSFWKRLFKDNIKWTLHTTMTCDLRYSIELAYLQHKMSSDGGYLSDKELKETAVFYFDDHKSRGLTCKAFGKNLKISKYRGIVFPVNDDNVKESYHPTYHAKISLVAYEKEGKTGFRLAVFSKNQEFDDYIAESAMLFDLVNTGQQTESGKALCAYLSDIKNHTSDDGKEWFEENISTDIMNDLTMMKLVSEFDSKEGKKEAELYFGGVRTTEHVSNNLCVLGSLLRLNEVEDDSIVLTPPEFIRGTEAENYFRNNTILYDINSKNSKERSASHMKLYLLHRKNENEDNYELWTGSANATKRGIGWDFENHKAEKESSVECLVKFSLSIDEFDSLRNGLLEVYGPDPFDFCTQTGSLPKEKEDRFGVWVINNATVKTVEYLDGSGKRIEYGDLQKKNENIWLQFVLELKETLPEKDIDSDGLEYWRPLEYSDLGEIYINEWKDSTIVTLKYEIEKYCPSQGALCFGKSQSILWIYPEVIGDLPLVEERARMDKRVSDLLLSRTQNSKKHDEIEWFHKLIVECDKELSEESDINE